MAVNQTTNRVYVANFDDATVTVIDGPSNTVIGTPIKVGTDPTGIAVNPVTNRIYMANHDDASVSVIDGANNTTIGLAIQLEGLINQVAVNSATNRIYASNPGRSTVGVIDGASNAIIGSQIPAGVSPIGIDVNPATNQIYAADGSRSNVIVLGVPFGIAASTTRPGTAITASWSKLFAPSNSDFVGLFAPDAPNTTPLSRRFTNGTAAPGGPGLGEGSVDLPIPADLVPGSYEVRLVSGPTGGTLARSRAVSPTAANDSFSVGGGNVLNVPAPGVLANDTEPDSSSLQAVVLTNPAHGTLTLQPTGALSYTPSATFSGADSFTYRAISQAGLPATATVTITVTAAPVGASDAFTVAAGGVLNVPPPGVLANDSDADSPLASLQVAVATPPTHGTLALQPNGAFSYTPAAGLLRIRRLHVSDHRPDQYVRAGVRHDRRHAHRPGARPDRHPHADADAADVNSGARHANTGQPGDDQCPADRRQRHVCGEQRVNLDRAGPGVLANDTDPDSPSLQATVVSNPSHGALSFQPNGGFTYTPNADFAGIDTFTYRASDGKAQSGVATASIVVAATTCGPRPTVQTSPVAGGGKLQVQIVTAPLNVQTLNPLSELRFGAFQNAKVTLDGQPIASGQTFTVPTRTNRVSFTVERVNPGQATTVPFTVVDGCGEWPTFVGGGTAAGF